MQPITFPSDGIVVDGQAEAQVAGERHRHKLHGEGTIEYGKPQEIIFDDNGSLHHNNDAFFSEPLLQGYFGAKSVLFSAPATKDRKTIVLTFDDKKDGHRYKFTLSSIPQIHK